MALQNEDNFNAMQLIKQEQALIERDIALQNDTLTANEKLLIEEEYQKKLRDIDDETQKHREENRDRNMDLAKDGMKALSEVADFIAEKQSKSINKKYDNEKKKAKGNEKLLNQIEKNRIIALNKANKKAFQMKKASDLASAVMDGYRSVLSTYAQTKGGPLIKGISAGIAGAFAGVQIAKIASSKFQGETFEPSEISASGGGGAGGTGGSIVSPEFNIVGDSGVNQLQDATPIQAYVVSGDVTTAQGLDRARIENATL